MKIEGIIDHSLTISTHDNTLSHYYIPNPPALFSIGIGALFLTQGLGLSELP